MGRLSDQLRKEQAADARRANQKAVARLTSNSADGSLSRHLDRINADASRERLQHGRELLSRRPQILDSVGSVGILQDRVPNLTLEEARYLIDEARPPAAPEPMELGYTGEISRNH